MIVYKISVCSPHEIDGVQNFMSFSAWFHLKEFIFFEIRFMLLNFCCYCYCFFFRGCRSMNILNGPQPLDVKLVAQCTFEENYYSITVKKFLSLVDIYDQLLDKSSQIMPINMVFRYAAPQIGSHTTKKKTF